MPDEESKGDNPLNPTALGKKAGPFPIYIYVVGLAALGVIAYYFLHKNSAATPATVTSTIDPNSGLPTSSGGASGGTGGTTGGGGSGIINSPSAFVCPNGSVVSDPSQCAVLAVGNPPTLPPTVNNNPIVIPTGVGGSFINATSDQMASWQAAYNAAVASANGYNAANPLPTPAQQQASIDTANAQELAGAIQPPPITIPSLSQPVTIPTLSGQTVFFQGNNGFPLGGPVVTPINGNLYTPNQVPFQQNQQSFWSRFNPFNLPTLYPPSQPPGIQQIYNPFPNSPPQVINPNIVNSPLGVAGHYVGNPNGSGSAWVAGGSLAPGGQGIGGITNGFAN